MNKPRGKLKFAYGTIVTLEARIKELEDQIKQLKEPDIYWLEEDPENGTDNIDCLLDFVDEDSIGQVIKLDLAKRLPSIEIQIKGFDEDNNVIYEVL